MRLSLRTKVTLTVSLFLVAVFGLVMYLTLTRDITQLRSSINQQSKSFASLATSPIGNTFVLYQESGSIKITQQVNQFLALDPDVTDLRIVSVDGDQVYSSQNKHYPPLSASLASSFQPRYVKNPGGYVQQIVQPFFEDSGVHRYAIVYDISTKRVEQNVDDAIRQILYAGVGILIVSIIVSSWALNVLFVRPLRQVSRSADSISAGNYNQQVISKNRDEIGSLARSVNKMAESLKGDIVKLQELDKLKSEFLMIASHNLRTPLTVMRGYLEMADQAASVDELKAIVRTIQESVTRLHLLSEDLLTISTLQAGAATQLTTTPTEAKSFVDSVVDEFQLLAEKKQLRWQFDNQLPEGAKFAINQADVRSALGNILDNAIKFTKEGGALNVRAAAEGGQVRLSVADTGIGIAPDEMPKLFTMFHRGTGTLHYDYEGAGIGLYLTKLIIERHGGRVAVESQVGHGSTFTVWLPLTPTPAGVKIA
ncbi:MAG TPA: HAMP domain-containing sensor histidine kinase [Candidatus Saccharimonadales bacterium]|nr:HAMP domain-containing sensor histidine kinase [Candidatus Saccharimonadales bacterium]